MVVSALIFLHPNFPLYSIQMWTMPACSDERECSTPSHTWHLGSYFTRFAVCTQRGISPWDYVQCRDLCAVAVCPAHTWGVTNLILQGSSDERRTCEPSSYASQMSQCWVFYRGSEGISCFFSRVSCVIKRYQISLLFNTLLGPCTLYLHVI